MSNETDKLQFLNISSCYTNYMPSDNPELRGHDGPPEKRSPFHQKKKDASLPQFAPHEQKPFHLRSLSDKVFKNLLGFWPKP